MRKPTTKIIHKGTHYTACLMKNGSLCVTKNQSQEGRLLNSDQAGDWVAAIIEAIDSHEAESLCSAVVQS